MAAKSTTMWKCRDVETPGEPGRIRKRLFIDLENNDKDSENQPPVSKKPKMDQQKQEPLLKEHLDRNWYLVISEFQGETKVHIRVYEQRHEDGKLHPTRKGIALDLEKWKKLSELCSEEIDAAIESHEAEMPVSYKKHLGENFFVTVETGFSLINIRKWWLPPNEKDIVPTRRGAALTFDEWEALKAQIPQVDEKIGDQLRNVEYCENSESHKNQMGFLQCARCNPNEFTNFSY